MSYGIALAEKMLRIVGPGSFLILGTGYDALRDALLKRGCVVHARDVTEHDVAAAAWAIDWPELIHDVGSVSTVLLCGDFAQGTQEAAELLAAVRPLSRRHVVLAPAPQWRRSGDNGRYAWWAQAAMAQGYRRAPAAFNAWEHKDQSALALADLVIFERLADDTTFAQADAPCEKCERGADFTRACGDAADTEAALYAFAGDWVRQGDVVLTLACGAGAGSALLASQSRARQIVGVDACDHCVAYARQQFAGGYGIEFHAADAAGAGRLPLADCSVDVITLLGESLPPAAVANLYPEIWRVLKPDGRLLLRMPRTPNSPAREGFMAEARYDLVPARDARNGEARTAIFRRTPAETFAGATQSVWVLSRDPLCHDATAVYHHPYFDGSQVAGSHVTDFGQFYENPWLYRSLVQMGERLTDEQELIALALRTMNGATFASPDVGAALTVIGYNLLSRRQFGQVADWRNLSSEYLALTTENPHTLRWQISLAYCRALLAQEMGERELARREFEAVAQMDALMFSPLLSTKVVGAAFWAGIMSLVDDDADAARKWLLAGVQAGRRALQSDDANAIGNPALPLSFGFQELAEVADMTSQCALALGSLPLYERSPGQFWRQVDVRRFGLATWAKNLEQENQSLREALRVAVQR